MARGGKRGHKGGRKQFTDPQALQRQKDKEEKEKEWRRKRGEDVDDSDEEDSGSEESSGDEAGAKGGAAARPSGRGGAKKQEESSSEEETSSEEDEEARGKGVEKLIDIENPNRVQKKHKKVDQIGTGPKPQLSRREREEIEKQKAKERYQKLHAQGKTEEARADLARLAIIRKQREDAAKKRADEQAAKEAAAKAKTESKQKK